MPQTNNIITPKERLMIATQIYCTNGGSVMGSLHAADEIIEQSGCIVEGQPALMHEMD